jgi:hypothetical protein
MLAETEQRGIAFDQLLTIPEQDDWVYSDGKSTTCVAFILAMYKEAGVFGPVSSSIQVTEFTVSHISESLSLFCNLLFWELYSIENLFSSWSLHMTWAHHLLQIRDAYMLKIFDDNQTRLPSWCNNVDGRLPFCQILGEYWMELPQYNTVEPYANMNENCPSLPPNYDRPVQC